MTYDWETDSTVLGLQEMAEEMAHKGFAVVGIVVWNQDTGEGALVRVPTSELMDIECADVWKDALGDCQNIYDEAVEGMWADKPKGRA